MLEASAARFGAQTCTNFLGKTISYSEIARMVDATAAGLQQLGIGQGTRVGLFLPNSPTFIVYYYAVLKIGGIVVNFNPLYTVEELAYQVRDSGTELMITLDLKVLFDKVEALIKEGVLPRAVVASFTAPPASDQGCAVPPVQGEAIWHGWIVPGWGSVSFRESASRLKGGSRSPSPSIRATSPSFSIRVARRAHPRGRC